MFFALNPEILIPQKKKIRLFFPLKTRVILDKKKKKSEKKWGFLLFRL